LWGFKRKTEDRDFQGKGVSLGSSLGTSFTQDGGREEVEIEVRKGETILIR